MHYSDVLKQDIIKTKSYIRWNTSEHAIVLYHIDKCKQSLKLMSKLHNKFFLQCTVYPSYKNPYEAFFIAKSSSYTTTKLLVLLTDCLTETVL